MHPESSVKVERMRVSEGDLWREVVRKVCGGEEWFPYADLTGYELWKKGLEAVGSFWTSQGERLAIVAARVKGDVAGLVRVLRVPIFSWQREIWRRSGGCRGEIQDLLIKPRYLGTSVGCNLLREAIMIVEEEGIGEVGASNWIPEYQGLFEEQEFKPYSRSILMGWKTSMDTYHLSRNADVRVTTIEREREDLVRRVFQLTWGFWVSILPNMKVHHPLVAMLGGEPVGAVLLNREGGNMDLGVQVVPEHRRRKIGTTRVIEALRHFRRNGFDRMYVVRNIGLEKLRPEDERAVKFYESTGGRLIREYVGMKLTL